MGGETRQMVCSVARNLGGLAGLANSGPSAAVFLDGWQHEALVDELRSFLNSGVDEGI